MIQVMPIKLLAARTSSFSVQLVVAMCISFSRLKALEFHSNLVCVVPVIVASNNLLSQSVNLIS